MRAAPTPSRRSCSLRVPCRARRSSGAARSFTTSRGSSAATARLCHGAAGHGEAGGGEDRGDRAEHACTTNQRRRFRHRSGQKSSVPAPLATGDGESRLARRPVDGEHRRCPRCPRRTPCRSRCPGTPPCRSADIASAHADVAALELEVAALVELRRAQATWAEQERIGFCFSASATPASSSLAESMYSPALVTAICVIGGACVNASASSLLPSSRQRRRATSASPTLRTS